MSAGDFDAARVSLLGGRLAQLRDANAARTPSESRTISWRRARSL
jgi:hypothetical protein